MEDWEVEFEWLKVRHTVKDAMGKSSLPDFQTILFLIGIQEFGHWQNVESFTKEQKQDLMHIAMCTILEPDGYFEFVGRDQDGWPHWKELKPFDVAGLKGQQELLQKNVIRYFKTLEKQNETFKHQI